jgi:hypothetical protein
MSFRHRQEILHMGDAAHRHGLAHGTRRLLVSEHDGRGAIGDERAVGALERACHERVLVALAPAEIIAQVLAHLRERIANAVLVVLGRDASERVGLIAVFLKIERRNATEDAGETTFDIGLVAHVGRLEQILADLRRRRRRHLLDPDDERKARTLRRDRVETLMHSCGTGGAGVLDPGRALEAQIGRGLQHQRRGEILRREARVEMAEHDLVDFARPNAGIRQRLVRDPHNQAFDGLALKLAKAGVGPPNDAGGHDVRPPSQAWPRYSEFISRQTR